MTIIVAILGPIVRSNAPGVRNAIRLGSILASWRPIVPLNPFNGVKVRLDEPVAPGVRGIVYGLADTPKSAVAEQVVDATALADLGV